MALYDAFVSYSHAKDKPIAAALQSDIQKLGKPWYRRRALRVFRDDTSLSATPHLWPSIERALKESRYFILLASPEAAASPWVNKEVAYWLEHKSADTLLIAVTEGKLAWDEAVGDFGWREGMPLPPVLAGRFASEPKWVDLSAYRNAADRRDAKFTELAADFAAAIRGMPKEDLLSQEVRQQRRALTQAWSAAGALLILAGFAGWQWKAAVDAEFVATEQKQIAERQSGLAKSEAVRAERNFGAAKTTIDLVIFDLVQGLRDVEGMRADTVRRILGRAEAAVALLVSKTENDPEVLSSQATMFHLFSDTYLTIGAARQAVEYARKSIDIRRGLASRDSGNLGALEGLSISLERLGDALRAGGKLADALEAYDEALAIDRALLARDAENIGWRRTLSVTLNKVGHVRRSQGDSAAALAAFRESLDIRRALAAKNPDDPYEQRNVSISLANVGEELIDQRDVAGALTAYRESLAIRRAIAGRDPDNTQWQRDVSLGLERIGHTLVDQGDLAGGLVAFREGLDVIRMLAAKDPGNTRWQRDLAVNIDNVGDVLRDSGNGREALGAYREAVEIFRKLVAKDPNVVEWQRDLSVCLENIGDVLLTQGDRAGALAVYREGLDIRRALAAKDASRPLWQRDILMSLTKIGDLLKATGDSDGALPAYRESLSIGRALTAKDPANPQWQRDLSLGLDSLGDLMLKQAQYADAHAAYRESLDIRRALSAKEPGNTKYQRDVSVSLNKVGDALFLSDDLDGALAAYREGLAVMRTLVAKAPGNAQWQNDLQYSANRIGAMAYYFVLAREFAKALEVADQAISLAPKKTWLYMKRAHALLCLGRTEEAQAIYLQYRGEKNVQGDKTWEALALEDFAALRKRGLVHPLMREIEAKFVPGR